MFQHELVEEIATSHPGYTELASTLASFLTTHPAPFIYINDSLTPRVSASVTSSLISTVVTSNISLYNIPKLVYAHVNAVACVTSRVLYDTVLNALAGWEPQWEEGCENWGADKGSRWNESVDAFVQGLRVVGADDKGKGRRKTRQREEVVWKVIFIERAERLKETMPELIVPLTRLSELTQQHITVIFHSVVQWEDIKPPLGASPDPFFIDVAPPGKQATIQRLISLFQSTASSLSSDSPYADAYHPSLLPLYTHFVNTLHSVCALFVIDPHELAYIAAARWPGFALAAEYAPTIPEDARMRLTRQFTPSLTAALNALYPRHTHATAWARDPSPSPPDSDVGLRALSRTAQFVLIAAFLASTNPAKTDLRMFGRGLDEKRRRRKRGGGSPRKGGGPAKVPQRLLGPLPFPLDRLLAILGILLEEYDVDTRPPAPEYTLPGEETDMELGRVGVYGTIAQLSALRLLHRTSPPERLDGPPAFKCGVGYEAALGIARVLDIPLNDLMWEPA